MHHVNEDRQQQLNLSNTVVLASRIGFSEFHDIAIGGLQ